MDNTRTKWNLTDWQSLAEGEEAREFLGNLIRPETLAKCAAFGSVIFLDNTIVLKNG